MPKRRKPFANGAGSILVCLGLVVAAVAATSWYTGIAALIALLTADAAILQIASRLTLARRAGWRETLRGAMAYLIMLAGYTAFDAALLFYPLHRLRSEAALGVTLAISAALVLILLVPWRLWPAFGLAAIDEKHWRGLRRRPGIAGHLDTAWRLTQDNDIFFGRGLFVSLALLVLAVGAILISGLLIPDESHSHAFATAAYAVLACASSWMIVQGSAKTLLPHYRHVRALRAADTEAPLAQMQIIASAAPACEAEKPAHSNDGDVDAMLLRCVRAGQTQLALAALGHGADPNVAPAPDDRDQRSALALAVLHPDLRLLRGFIAKGADLHRAHAGMPPLIAATRDSREGRPEAVMTLLTNGADANCADADGNTPLHFAALAEKPVVAALLCDAGARIDAINREGQTPLARACEAANWGLVKFLLERGAKAEVAQSQPALIAAAMTDDDDPQGVTLLLKRKVRVDARDALQRTALMTAALHGNADTVRVLLEAGAQIDAADAQGTTALMEAARADAMDVIDTLAAHRPAPDAVDNAGRTALMIAAQSLRAGEGTVRRLLTLGISRQIPAADGRRAVEYAANAGRWNVVALIDPEFPRPSNLAGDAGASTSVSEDSPEHLLDALRFGHWNIVENFAECAREWPQSVLAQTFADLIEHSDPSPRRWLLNHGLQADARVLEATLLQHAFAQLPASLAAVRDLLDAGAQPTGGNRLAQTCVAFSGMADADDDPETFALSLLERGADATRADAAGLTPLAHAAANGWTRLTDALLARGADANARDRSGRTPLFAALAAPEATRETVLKALLYAGADPEVRAANNETPLGVALARGQSHLQRWLNWPGWKLPQRRLRANDLIAAAGCGDPNAVGKLLELGISVDATDDYCATPLLHAAGRGRSDVAALLLDRGANPAHAAADGATALSAAVAARHRNIVDLLVARGADVDQRLADGGTALMAAVGRGDAEMAAALMAHGARIDIADAHGMGVLHAAAQFAFGDGDVRRARGVFDMLLDTGAAVDARNADGQTPLLVLLGARAQPRSGADQKALLDILEMLRLRGARIDVQDERGVSPLHACAMHGLLLPARALLAAGADPQCVDLLERQPREVAHLLGFIDVATELGRVRAQKLG